MLNYYEILGIEPGCSSGEIKSSFRKKAKEMHPDLKSTTEQSSEERMRDLLDAYEILSNPAKREKYDRAFALYLSKIKFNYREYLKSHQQDPYYQAKLIFHDLLHSQTEEAIELYDSLVSANQELCLEELLDYEDTMDCLFLLAEAFEKRGEYIKSFELYKRLYTMEVRRPYFHHFIEEVIERLRNITCFKMATTLPPHLAIHHIQDLIFFNFTRKDNAFFYKKIAEIYSNLGKNRLAAHYLSKGLKLDKKLPGVKKLKEKIGYSEIPVL